MKLDFEYGEGTMSANLPDTTDVFIPGVTIPDPPVLPQDWDSLYAETLKSLRNPIGMDPIGVNEKMIITATINPKIVSCLVVNGFAELFISISSLLSLPFGMRYGDGSALLAQVRF